MIVAFHAELNDELSSARKSTVSVVLEETPCHESELVGPRSVPILPPMLLDCARRKRMVSDFPNRDQVGIMRFLRVLSKNMSGEIGTDRGPTGTCRAQLVGDAFPRHLDMKLQTWR